MHILSTVSTECILSTWRFYMNTTKRNWICNALFRNNAFFCSKMINFENCIDISILSLLDHQYCQGHFGNFIFCQKTMNYCFALIFELFESSKYPVLAKRKSAHFHFAWIFQKKTKNGRKNHVFPKSSIWSYLEGLWCRSTTKDT